jgi:hypothetical protein
MKTKIAIEFEVEIDTGTNSDYMYYQDEISDLVDMIAEDVVSGSTAIRYTGEWRYITENDNSYELGILTDSEWI